MKVVVISLPLLGDIQRDLVPKLARARLSCVLQASFMQIEIVPGLVGGIPLKSEEKQFRRIFLQTV